jgi:hypothetical protein
MAGNIIYITAMVDPVYPCHGRLNPSKQQPHGDHWTVPRLTERPAFVDGIRIEKVSTRQGLE